MKTPEEWCRVKWYDIIEIIKEIQMDAYNQALDDLMNDVERSSFDVKIKEVIRQITEILKK